MPGGSVVVGSGGSTDSGLISFSGQNVDLSSSTIALESVGTGMGSVAAIPNTSTYSYAGFGLDTNAEWDPFQALTTTSAYPSLARMGTVTPALWYYPFGNGSPGPTSSALPLPTTPYQMETDLRTNSFIYDYVFVANSDPSVTFNVYMPTPGTRAPSDPTTVEFVGSYVNPLTGVPSLNYLYCHG